MDYSVIILAGGKGKRMNSDVLKPLVPLHGKRMIEYVIETFLFAGITNIIVVSHPLGVDEISKIPGVTKVVVQEQALGTFHALKVGIQEVSSSTKYVFVTPADKPLLDSDNIRQIMQLNDQVIYGYPSTTQYSAVLICNKNRVERIAEDPEDIKKVNANQMYRNGGVYCFRVDDINRLECDKHILRNNKNNEYYLTDVIPLLLSRPLLHSVEKRLVANINTPEELQSISNLFTNIGEVGSVVVTEAHARLNLMGRHIDHQGGYINTILLPPSIKAVLTPRIDLFMNRHILKSIYGTYYYDNDQEIPKDSMMYLVAPINYLTNIIKLQLRPCMIEVNGDIPQGAGLSSSSAIIVAVMKALIKYNNIEISEATLVKYCGEAEKLVGTNGGSGDHAAMIMGRPNSVTRMITSNVDSCSMVELPKGLGIAVINSGEVALKGFGMKTAYNDKIECYREGLTICNKHFGITSLNELTKEMFNYLVRQNLLEMRVRKVIEYGLKEMERAKNFVNVLQIGNLQEIGNSIRESQNDERNLYGCSTPKIDSMIDQIATIEGILGSQICGLD